MTADEMDKKIEFILVSVIERRITGPDHAPRP